MLFEIQDAFASSLTQRKQTRKKRERGRKEKHRDNAIKIQPLERPPPSPEVHCNQPDNLQSQVMTSHGRVRSRPSPRRVVAAAAGCIPVSVRGWLSVGRRRPEEMAEG